MPPESSIRKTNIRRFADGIEERTVDNLAVEEPLEIRIGFSQSGKRVERPISITMRTPGHDEELAAGFLFTEAIVSSPAQVSEIRRVASASRDNAGRRSLPVTSKHRVSSNSILVELVDGTSIDIKRLERHFYTTSSCGVCGKSSIDALRTNVRAIDSDLIVTRSVISSLPGRLGKSQDIFASTGGLHASALFTTNGDLDIVREDVGRHNALDKVIGAKFVAGATPVGDRVLLVSGRASFELVQKALMAGIPVLAAVGAPSSLAVELADEFGMTVIGFLREERFNIYTHPERVVTE